MDSLRPQYGRMTEDEVARHEREINRVAWVGGIGVTVVTTVLLGLLVATQADHVWEYSIYSLLGGVPLSYGLFSHFVIGRMHGTLLHRYQSQLIIQLAEMQDMASRDELTGLYNRRYFYDFIQNELGKARVSKEPLALLVMDIDGLKGINDEYGHGVGDIIIANFGKVILKHTRNRDVPARLGGDEFSIIMPGTDKRGAFSLARRLWEELEQTPMFEKESKYVMVTVSIGVSGFPWGGEDLDELIQWADADMYANKVSRRLSKETVPPGRQDDIDSLPDDHVVGI